MDETSHVEVRACGRCGEHKPVDSFAWRRRSKDQRDNYCRSCRAAYKREHYAANRERYISNAGDRRRVIVAERTEWLLAYLRAHPCRDCGEADPVVLEFDHIGEKRFDISKGIRDRSWSAVLAEIARCEVVCANCHRRRTAHRGRHSRLLAARAAAVEHGAAR